MADQLYFVEITVERAVLVPIAAPSPADARTIANNIAQEALETETPAKEKITVWKPIRQTPANVKDDKIGPFPLSDLVYTAERTTFLDGLEIGDVLNAR